MHGPIEDIEHPEKGQDVGFEFKKNIDQSPIFVEPILLYAYIYWLYFAEIMHVPRFLALLFLSSLKNNLLFFVFLSL